MSNSHDYQIANQNGANTRTDLNNVLGDIQSTNSGTSEPTTKVAGKLWIDTTNNLIKLRNSANNAWVSLGSSNTADMGHAPIASPTFTGTLTTPEISCSGTSRLKLPVGTSGERPGSPATGDTRYNSTISAAETYSGSTWEQLGGAPTGAVFAMAHSTVPSGYLECNGAAVSRSTYANLFSVLSTTYGTGDGSSTFNLPDLRGEFIRGWDNSRGIDSGRAIASYQADENKAHTHSVTDPGHTHTWVRQDSQNDANYRPWPASNNDCVASTQNTGSSTTGISIASSGSESRPRNYAMMYVIKF
tara:strand:- start:32 stop:937 length:906 start_codon:yes stop_codon:yes gene_type:complete